MPRIPEPARAPENEQEVLDRIFFALSASVRRKILDRLDGRSHLVSELAEPFEMSVQAISQHIQVLEGAGLIKKERTGRVSHCSLDAGPIVDAAVWLNRYSKYWQGQFNLLAATLVEIEERRNVSVPKASRARKRPSRRK